MFAAFYSDFQTSRPFQNLKVNGYVSKRPHGHYSALDAAWTLLCARRRMDITLR